MSQSPDWFILFMVLRMDWMSVLGEASALELACGSGWVYALAPVYESLLGLA